MSCDECIRILKKDPQWQRIPVLFLTAQSDVSLLVLGLAELGADDYLPKPFDADEAVVKELVLADEKILAALEGRSIRKLILVPGRIVNLIPGD